MAVHVHHHYPGLYYAPGRWPTRDGCIPYHLLLVYWSAMWSGYALERLHLAKAIALSRMSPAERAPEEREAFGGVFRG